ncbi:MAG: MFS transporter [Eubacteriales bacterium]
MLNVVLLGLVSFFSDVSSEMVYPIIPLYLVNVFGATPAMVGIIEGIAESLASILKVFSGHIADKYRHKKPLAFIGYSGGLFYKAALVFATSWVGILGARVIDRLGKGIRTAPRDVLICESAPKDNLGKSFGLHKALDMAGSALGILISFFLVNFSKGDFNYKRLFIISAIPAFIGLILLSSVKEKKLPRCEIERENFFKNFKKLDIRLKLFLFIAFLFTLGNSSNAFLLLRAQNKGFSESGVILLYFIYNVSASLFAMPLGKLSDKIGRKRLLVLAYVVFAFVYFGFAVAPNKASIVVLFFIYGIYTAMNSGAERAFIAEISPKELKGTMLGLDSSLVGIALLPASTIAGFLFVVSPAAPFFFGGSLALAAAIGLNFAMKKPDVGNALHAFRETP